MKRHVLSGIIGALVAGVTVFAIIFFWKNPFRQGVISFTTPSGTSMTLNVSNTKAVAELISIPDCHCDIKSAFQSNVFEKNHKLLIDKTFRLLIGI